MEENIIEEKDLLKFLKKVPIFSKLSKNDLKHLRQHLYIRSYEAGEQLFKKNYPNVVFYILYKGELKVYLMDKKEEIELNRLKPTDQLGAIGLFKDEKRTASVIALEDSIVLGISKKELSSFVNRFPQAGIKILYELGASLSEQIIMLNNRLYK